MQDCHAEGCSRYPIYGSFQGNRRAVHDFRTREQCNSKHPLQVALARTAGIWQVGNGLEFQECIRKEWT